MDRLLVLEDGTVFKGKGFGGPCSSSGEVVFTTGMTGYQEAITDQSFNGQILTFTYPLIGNYGINRDNYESIYPTCKGVIVKEYARRPSNWRQSMSLDEFLKEKNIPGIANIDTRMLTKILRSAGTMKGAIVDHTQDVDYILDQLRATIFPANQVEQVSTHRAYPCPGIGKNIVVIDFGLKHSILRELTKRQCNLTVLPYHTTGEEILALHPDGVLLSNGPGNPEDLPEVLQMIQRIQGKVPIFGICLGHQLIALANGAKTYKMPFGHRGFNHPVREIATGKINFTSQNHGFAVDKESLKETNLMITHVEINDGTVEGLKHRHEPVFTAQFHPDAAPGPHDAVYLFDEFMELIDTWKETKRCRNEQI